VLGAILYWLAVVAVSLALVIGLILLLESRDQSDIGGRGGTDASGPRAEGRRATRPITGLERPRNPAADRSSRANTTIRFAAL
jgi:hypothetical protein